ncbi:MAG: hypothetical protein AVDCRST_MAG08-2805, partial [uncultured Acetobacteraceae bacterium]
ERARDGLRRPAGGRVVAGGGEARLGRPDHAPRVRRLRRVLGRAAPALPDAGAPVGAARARHGSAGAGGHRPERRRHAARAPVRRADAPDRRHAAAPPRHPPAAGRGAGRPLPGPDLGLGPAGLHGLDAGSGADRHERLRRRAAGERAGRGLALHGPRLDAGRHRGPRRDHGRLGPRSGSRRTGGPHARPRPRRPRRRGGRHGGRRRAANI